MVASAGPLPGDVGVSPTIKFPLRLAGEGGQGDEVYQLADCQRIDGRGPHTLLSGLTDCGIHHQGSSDPSCLHTFWEVTLWAGEVENCNQNYVTFWLQHLYNLGRIAIYKLSE